MDKYMGLDNQHVNAGCPLFVPAQPTALSVSLRGREGGATAELGDEVGNCLRASSGGGDKAHVLAPVAFHENQRGELTLNDTVGTIKCAGGKPGQGYPAVAYGIRTANTSSNGWGIQEEVTHTLDTAQGVAVAYTTKLHNTTSNQAGKFYREYATSLDANSPPPAVIAPVRYGEHQQDTLHHESGIMSTLPGGTNRNAGHFTATVQAMAVRRLTPEECEKLQGFPVGYTAIPWRKKPASECPDGPRYKALGNSWAVPVVRWIGGRINNAMEATQ
jgi:DNA (cytosine-5)-methyltransferase 1